MLKESIHICHNRGDAHWLTPDPAWSGYSFGLNLCIRDRNLGDRSTTPLADAAAGAVAHLFGRVRGARVAGA